MFTMEVFLSSRDLLRPKWTHLVDNFLCCIIPTFRASSFRKYDPKANSAFKVKYLAFLEIFKNPYNSAVVEARKIYENVKGIDGHGLELFFRTFCSRMNWNHYKKFGSPSIIHIMEISMSRAMYSYLLCSLSKYIIISP